MSEETGNGKGKAIFCYNCNAKNEVKTKECCKCGADLKDNEAKK